MSLSIHRDFDPEEWNNYLRINGHATFYHTLEWRSILENVFHYSTSYVVCRNEKGDIEGILPLALVKSKITGNRVVSLPLSQYAGPLANGENALESMITYARQYLKNGFEYVRLRCRDSLEDHIIVKTGLKTVERSYRSFIPLTNRTEEELWKSLDRRSVRWAIKKSSRDGVTVDLRDDMSDVNCVRVMMLRTCKKHGTPPYPATLLTSINGILAPKHMTRILEARLGEKIVAVTVLFTMKDEATYAYNFSDPRYLRAYPNNALIWTAIKWSLKNGLRTLDLGISSPEDKELHSFKKRWGTIEQKLHEYYLVEGDRATQFDRRATMKYKAATLAWRFLVPQFVASRVGPSLLKHLE